jgi:hypothetical protein
MLQKQIELWQSYSDDIKNKVKFILVDDGSMQRACRVEHLVDDDNIDISVYRITKDIYCNIPGAVNLGAKVCETEWMFKHDIDHLLSEESIEKMIELMPNKGKVYKFYRHNGTDISNPNKIAPGQFMIRVDDFWKVGGWDEDFCGNYGQNDPAFFWRAKGIIETEERYDINMVIDSEGETPEIDRTKRDVNAKLFEEKKRTGEWSYDFLRFDWEKIY